MILQNYIYKGTIKKVIDGDTVDCEIDVGFKMFSEQRLRLARIDAPELNSKDPVEREKAQAAKARVLELVGGKEIIVQTQKTDLYGRYLGEIYFVDTAGSQINLSDLLLEEGLVVPYS